MYKKFVRLSILLLVFALNSNLVSAGFVKGDAKISDVTINGENALAALGAFQGNDSQMGGARGLQILNSDPSPFTNVPGSFSFDWQFAGSTDDGSTVFKSADSDQRSGILELNHPLAGPFVIALKGSTFFSMYLFNPTSSVSTIEFTTTTGVATNSNNGKGPGLSHASLYTPVNQPVAAPAPGALTLLFAGLVSCGLLHWGVRHRKTLGNLLLFS